MKSCCLLTLLLWNLSLGAQQIVEGKVLDAETEDPLVGAHVYLMAHWRVGTVTDDHGYYKLQIPDEARGDSMIISFLGFKEQVLKVKSGLLVRLDPKASVWQEVVVSAEPLIAEEFKYLEISKLEIYTNPTAKADPILAVNSLPAATTTDESANISLRGSSPLETGVYLNNVPVYDAVRYSQLNGIGTFSLFNTSIIKKVTVFPGNPPLEYGNATSGIISLITDERIVGENSNSLIISLANIGYTREQKLSSRQSLKLFTNYQPSRVIKALNEKSLEEIQSFQSVDLGAYYYGSHRQLQWKIFNYSLLEGYEFKFHHPSYQGIFDQNKKRSFTTASIERTAGSSTLALNVGASFSKGLFSYSNVRFEVVKRDLFSGLNYTHGGTNHQLKAGVSYDHRLSFLEGTLHRYAYALAAHHPLDSLKEDVKTRSLESFIYYKHYFGENLTIGTGIRKNIPNGDQSSYWSRQINVAYQLAAWSFTLGAGKYYKYGLEENNTGLLKVSSAQWALDVKFTETDWTATASVFSKRVLINDNSFDITGLEFYTSLELSEKISGSVAFTWLNAANAQGKPYPYDLSYFIKSNIAYKPDPMWTIESIISSRDGVPFYPLEDAIFDPELQVFKPRLATDSARKPAYFSLGISVSKLFVISDRMALIAFASINNLTNHDNVRSYNYSYDYQVRTPAFYSRRTGYVGAVINF